MNEIIAHIEETVPAPDMYYYWGNDYALPLSDVECLDIYYHDFSEEPVLILPEGKQDGTYENCKIHITIEVVRESNDE